VGFDNLLYIVQSTSRDQVLATLEAVAALFPAAAGSSSPG
jgi:hypothetical protein